VSGAGRGAAEDGREAADGAVVVPDAREDVVDGERVVADEVTVAGLSNVRGTLVGFGTRLLACLPGRSHNACTGLADGHRPSSRPGGELLPSQQSRPTTRVRIKS
jgi:hypothetical protein